MAYKHYSTAQKVIHHLQPVNRLETSAEKLARNLKTYGTRLLNRLLVETSDLFVKTQPTSHSWRPFRPTKRLTQLLQSKKKQPTHSLQLYRPDLNLNYSYRLFFPGNSAAFRNLPGLFPNYFPQF